MTEPLKIEDVTYGMTIKGPESRSGNTYTVTGFRTDRDAPEVCIGPGALGEGWWVYLKHCSIPKTWGQVFYEVMYPGGKWASEVGYHAGFEQKAQDFIAEYERRKK